jgi:hypothetical protein
MAVSLERLARNQALFREVNERLVELAQGFNGGPLECVCECSKDDCTDTIAVLGGEYESVRAEPMHFLVVPGHETLDVERVVRNGHPFLVVEKFVDPGPGA